MNSHEQDFEVARMCDVFEVSRSGYYAWKNRPVSPRAASQQELIAAMREIHAQMREVYGSPRMHQELLKRGFEVSENTVAKLMKSAGIQAKMKADQLKRDADAKAREAQMAKEKAAREAAAKTAAEAAEAEAKAAEEAKAKAASKPRFTEFIAEHKVVSGDNLSFISQKYYNTQANFRLIYEANKEIIGDNPNLIRVGQVLKIPKL